MEIKQSTEKSGETIDRILDAAMAVFSDLGFGSTRVDEIARRAGVNKATIYYHIGNKETLYARVIQRTIKGIANAIKAGVQQAYSPEEKIRIYVRTVVREIGNNPQMPQIMMRELASGGQNLPYVILEDFVSIIGTVTSIIDEGVSNGLFVPTTPFILHMMVIGSVMFFQASTPIRERAGRSAEEISSINEIRAEDFALEIEDIVLRALKK